MKTKLKIPQETSVYMRYVHQHGGMKISHVVKQYTQFAERSIYTRTRRTLEKCKTEENIIMEDHQNSIGGMKEK